MLPQGVLVFVRPEHYLDTTHALVGLELHPSHVSIEEGFEFMIEEVLRCPGTRSCLSWMEEEVYLVPLATRLRIGSDDKECWFGK